jgi:hypothetical protein
LIKKVNSIAKPEAIDKKDPREIINVLLYYWDLKRVYGQREENSSTFASTLREIIHKLYVPIFLVNNLRRHKGESVQLPSERPPSPDEDQPLCILIYSFNQLTVGVIPATVKTSQSPPGTLSLRANESLSSTSDTSDRSVDSSLEEQLQYGCTLCC